MTKQKPTQKPTRESIIQAWKELDAKSDKPVGQIAVANAMGISPYWISQLFIGESLTEMERKYKIRFSPQEKHLSDDDLFSLLDKFFLSTKVFQAGNYFTKKQVSRRALGRRNLVATEGVPRQTSTGNSVFG